VSLLMKEAVASCTMVRRPEDDVALAAFVACGVVMAYALIWLFQHIQTPDWALPF
jgi:hypothetical protein